MNQLTKEAIPEIMNKHLLFSILLTLISLFAGRSYSQPVSVTNIEAAPKNSVIEINYSIPGSTSDQYYSISISVSIDGGTQRKVNSVSGDVGSRVQGGKTRFTAVWDVFKDVAQVNTAEFYIDAQLLTPVTGSRRSSRPTFSSKWNSRNWVILAEASIEPGYAEAFGGRVAFVRRWGAYVAFHSGTDFYPYESFIKFTGGITRNIYRTKRTGLDIYLGAGHSTYYDGTVAEGGLIFGVGLLTVTAGYANDDGCPFLNGGLGIRF
jgi:hypothetical protein